MSEDHKGLFISQGLNQLKKKKKKFNHILLELKVSSENFNNRLINTNSSYNAVWIIKDYFSILLYKKLDHTLVLWLDCEFFVFSCGNGAPQGYWGKHGQCVPFIPSIFHLLGSTVPSHQPLQGPPMPQGASPSISWLSSRAPARRWACQPALLSTQGASLWPRLWLGDVRLAKSHFSLPASRSHSSLYWLWTCSTWCPTKLFLWGPVSRSRGSAGWGGG